MILSRRRYVSGGGGYLLDTYTGSITAYSLRKLTSSAVYACKVRRSSDSATCDVLLETSGSIALSSSIANLSGGSGSTLSAWIGSDSGYIEIWYDQTGTSNAAQSTTTLQPILVNAGALITENGNAAISFPTSGMRLDCGLGMYNKAVLDLFYVRSGGANLKSILIKATSNTSAFGLVSASGDSSTSIYNLYGTPAFYNNGTLAGWITRANVYTAIQSDGLQHLIYEKGADTTNSLWNAGITFSGYTAGAFIFTGEMQEFIAYESDQSANKSGIESNINSHYSIY